MAITYSPEIDDRTRNRCGARREEQGQVMAGEANSRGTTGGQMRNSRVWKLMKMHGQRKEQDPEVGKEEKQN